MKPNKRKASLTGKPKVGRKENLTHDCIAPLHDTKVEEDKEAIKNGIQSANVTKSGFNKFLADKLSDIKKAQLKKFVVQEKYPKISQTPSLDTPLTKDNQYVHRLVGGKVFQRGPVPASGPPKKIPLKFELKNPGKYKGSKLEDYKIQKLLGHGSYAEVKEAVHKQTGEGVALKIYEKSALVDPLNKNSVLKEIQVLESLSHPNIVKIFDCINTGKNVVIVLELVQGIPLNQYMEGLKDNCLDEPTAFKIFKQIVSAVEYCHSRGISHRDLKLENVLIRPDQHAKLIDFGFSVWVKKEGKLKVFCGTPTYMAPEIINRPEYDGPPTDIWALGVILYTLICGQFPFNSPINSELYRRITKGIYSFPSHVSTAAQRLINDMLIVDPNKRINASQLLKCVNLI